MMSSFGFRLIAALLLVGLCGLQQVEASDLDDCHGNVLDRIEPACTAIINNQSRAQDERLKAYIARSQLFANRAKYDNALADAEAALRLDPKFVPALQARAYAHQRTGNLDQALADLNQAIELDPKNLPTRSQTSARRSSCARTLRWLTWRGDTPTWKWAGSIRR
jgi:tetratricopeptide (TPR) repeat protein